MNDNNILTALLYELIRRFSQQDNLEQRIAKLEAICGIAPAEANSRAVPQPTPMHIPQPSVQPTPQAPFVAPTSSPIHRSVSYFKDLERDEDGERYVATRGIHSEPDNYEMTIDGDKAEVRFTTDKRLIREMMEKYVEYFQPCKKVNNPSIGCGVETVEPGLFELEGNRWMMTKKITIKFT